MGIIIYYPFLPVFQTIGPAHFWHDVKQQKVINRTPLNANDDAASWIQKHEEREFRTPSVLKSVEKWTWYRAHADKSPSITT